MNVSAKIPGLSGLVLLGLLAGCDGRAIAQADETPFAVAGIALGARRDALPAERALRFCEPEGASRIECSLNLEDKRYMFLDALVERVSVRFPDPPTQVVGLDFHVKGKIAHRIEAERRWSLEGRCLGYTDYDDAQRHDRTGAGLFVEILREARVISSSYSDFVCLGEDDAFMKVWGVDDDSAIVEMFYLRDEFARGLRHLLDFKERRANRREDVRKLFGD